MIGRTASGKSTLALVSLVQVLLRLVEDSDADFCLSLRLFFASPILWLEPSSSTDWISRRLESKIFELLSPLYLKTRFVLFLFCSPVWNKLVLFIVSTTDPLLWTLRENLDPFATKSDEELLAVLRRVYLVTERTTSTAPPSRVPSFLVLPDLTEPRNLYDDPSLPLSISASPVLEEKKVVITLDSAVSAGDLNFSSGQRQFISLGRALLRGNNVVIMDEAVS